MKRWLDTVVMVLGFLSFLSLVGFFLALHDIWHDFASPEIWARAGQTLPSWYDPLNQCPGEWRMLQVGFLLVLAFHLALFVRLLALNYKRPIVS